jgi:hypothetical protein
MDTLEELLKMPRACKREVFWARLTTGEVLFAALRQAVGERAVGTATRWVETWHPFVERSSLQNQWSVVCTLAWCAEQAANRPEFYRDESNRSHFARGAQEDAPRHIKEYVKANEAWVWGCVRTLIPNTRTRGLSLHVPVAGWDKRRRKGFLCTLVLDVLERGTGDVFHHPGDAFSTAVDQEFSAAMGDAWRAALRWARGRGVDVLCDGRWRLLRGWSMAAEKRELLAPVAEANSRSASGAAARGWCYALGGWVPDNRVIVVAQVDPNDGAHLLGVDDEGVFEKTKEILKYDDFDTIIVADERNKARALGALAQASHVRVIMPVEYAAAPSD